MRDTEDRAPCDQADVVTQEDVRIGKKERKKESIQIKNLSTCCLSFYFYLEMRSLVVSRMCKRVNPCPFVTVLRSMKDPHNNTSGIQWDIHHLNLGMQCADAP